MTDVTRDYYKNRINVLSKEGSNLATDFLGFYVDPLEFILFALSTYINGYKEISHD